MGLHIGIYGAASIGSGPLVAGRSGNDRHFLETLFEVWARARLSSLVPVKHSRQQV